MSDSDASSPAIHISQTKPVTLQVGGQRFVTRAKTLVEGSGYFCSLLSGRWDSTNSKQEDGSYFVDADPDVFQHVLRYLRHSLLPLFYDGVKGHDYPLYLAVLEQARYFQISPLQRWIEDKEYLRAVQIVRSAVVYDGTDEVAETTGADVQVEYYPAWTTEKVYVCPRGIHVHRGNPSACGRACMNAQGDAEDEYVDEEVLKMVEVRKKIVFDEQMCLEGR
ncbi:hypothetical protein MMC28_001357 [Mycoblastus sanguinarius]|nr:hypothetical protein [Mycoblastus sanguinarius]